MDLTAEQARIVEEIHAFAEKSNPMSLDSRLWCAAYMARVLDHFATLEHFCLGIHHYNGRVVTGFVDIARRMLELALSVEHAGLDRLLTAFLEDYSSDTRALARASANDLMLLLPATAETPTIVSDDLKVPHCLATMAVLFPRWVEHSISKLFDAAASGDKRYSAFCRWISKATFTKHPTSEAHRKVLLEFCTAQVRNAMGRVQDVGIELHDPRRCELLGPQPSKMECVNRLEKVLIFFQTGQFLPLDCHNKISPQTVVQNFTEIVKTCPEVDHFMLAGALQHFLSTGRRVAPFDTCLLPGESEGSSAVESGGVAKNKVFLRRAFGPLYEMLIELGVSPARCFANAKLPDSDHGVVSICESDALVRIVNHMPEPGEQITLQHFWMQGILIMTEVGRLLALPLSDDDRFNLYRVTQDDRFRDVITDERILETLLHYDLGL